MTHQESRAQVKNARRVVVKIGSALLAAHGSRFIARLAKEMAAHSNKEFVIVSSGAIALGLAPMQY